MDAVISGMLWGLLAGMAFGTVPVLVGAFKQKLGLGLAGFFACSLGGAFLGMLLAVPICGVFVYLIIKKSKAGACQP